MSSSFENALIEGFEQLHYINFSVDLSQTILFVCGGQIDAGAVVPQSLRQRFCIYTATKNQNIHDSIVLAESFMDYFEENKYKDLFKFEDDIANFSTMVVIFLESPGAMVELGMFCSHPEHFKKLLVIAPYEYTKSENSFIYLGPLKYIRKADSTAVQIYPWPKEDVFQYPEEHLADITTVIEEKISKQDKSKRFDIKNSGHLSFLICEIIRLGFPIIKSEIELSLAAMDIDVTAKDITRSLYILRKVGLIELFEYSSYSFYYPKFPKIKRIYFGKTKNGKVLDSAQITLQLRQAFVTRSDSQSKKRQTALKQIMEILNA